MILGDEAAQGEDLNLMLDPILATMAMAEPQLSTLLNEARRHLTGTRRPASLCFYCLEGWKTDD